MFAFLGITVVSLCHCVNYTIICNTSKNFFNYRHMVDTQLLYSTFIQNGFTDREIVFLQQEDISKDIRNTNKGRIFINKTEDIPVIPLPETLINLHTLHNILYLNHPKLHTLNENDNLLIYLCGHANDDFFKLVDRYFLMKDDIHRILTYLSKRLNKVLLILDTCQAEALIDRSKLEENICVLTTSVANESSYSTTPNHKIGVNVVDDFMLLFYQNAKNYKQSVHSFFNKTDFPLKSTLTANKSSRFQTEDFFFQIKRKPTQRFKL